jgi:hypothetical protein
MSETVANPDQLIHSSVIEYASAALRGEPLLYPGERPTESYVTDGTTVTSIRTSVDGDRLRFDTYDDSGQVITLDEYLKQHGAAPMSERIPVLAYGANVSPGSLLAKYQKVGRDDALVIPTLYTELEGYDVVWSAGPGSNGNFIASLYTGEETTDTKVQVAINFLTREQLLVLHGTELSYDLRTVKTSAEGTEVPAYFYAGKDHVFIDAIGRPVAVDGVPATNRGIYAASTVQMLEDILRDSDIVEDLRAVQANFPVEPLTAEGYVAYVKSLRKSPEDQTPRGDLKARLHKVIKNRGMSRLMDNSHGELMSWANPSTLPTYGESVAGIKHHDVHVLPSSELLIDAWPDAAKRQVVLDAVSTHFHKHFPKSTG